MERVRAENAMSAVNGRSEDVIVGETAGKKGAGTKTEREICATFVDGLRGGAGTGVWGGKISEAGRRREGRRESLAQDAGNWSVRGIFFPALGRLELGSGLGVEWSG